jgi:hypothetical protein
MMGNPLKPEKAEDAFYELPVIDQADELHLTAASGTTERVPFDDDVKTGSFDLVGPSIVCQKEI